MVDSTGLQLPAPTDWPAFERVARELFAREYGCPITELVGRSGQDQDGIDIIGRRPEGKRGYFGIQCKLKDDLGAHRNLRRSTLEAEVARASKIRPALSEFVLATTAANDVELQNHARALSAEREADSHPMDIKVLGWDQLRAMIGQHRDILERYLGIEGIPDLAEQSKEQHKEAMEASAARHAEVMDMIGKVLAGQAPVNIIAPPIDQDDPRLARAINRIRAKLDGNDVRGGLRDLEALREDEWSDASPTLRFRMLSNLGAARWKLGEYDAATALFREAAAVKPDDPVALSNLSAAETHAGNASEGLRAARRLLEIAPDSTDVLLPLIQAQEAVAPCKDPLEAVPEAMRGSEVAIVGAVEVYRDRDDAVWLEVVASGLAQHPESEMLARMHADATLYRLAAVDGSHVGAANADSPSKEEIEQAVEVLSRNWQAALACDPVLPDVSIAQNLAQLLRALERHAEALIVLEEAERYCAESAQIAHLHALLLASLDRIEEAKYRLRANIADPASRILLCQLSNQEPKEVRALLADARLPGGSREAMWQGVLDAEARADIEQEFDPSSELEAVAAAFPDNLVPLLSLGKRAVGLEERKAVAKRVVAAATPQTPFADVLQACLWLREADLPGLAVEILDGRTNRSEDSTALRWLFEGWFALNDRASLAAALDALPAGLAAQPRYLYFRHRAAYRAGDMASALAAVERLIAIDPYNLGTRLDWLQIKHRLADRASVDAWLESPVEDLEGTPEQRADLALLLANHGFYDRARRLAYRLARLFPGNRRVLERYTGTMFNPTLSGTTDLGLSRIGADSVFTVTGEKGEERTYRIDGERDLPSEAIDLEPDSPIASAANGLREGDSFELPSGLAGMPPKRFKVASVLHKHIHHLRWLTDVMPDRFDGPQVVYKATVDPEDGSGLEALVDHLREQEQAAREASADYLASGHPLRVIAEMSGRSIIDTYDGMRTIDNGGFVASEGGGPEFDQECEMVIANRRRGCVADTVTVEIIRRHDLLDIVRAIAGPITIAQTTVDEFIDRAHKGELFAGRLEGNMSQRDGKLVAQKVYPAQIDVEADARRAALDWLNRNTQVRAAIGPPALARKLAELLPYQLSDQFQDEVLIAAETNLLLLTDDLGYRRFAGGAGIRCRAGLAALLRVALAAHQIDFTRYVSVIAALGQARHRFISADSEDLAEAFEQDGRSIGSKLRGIANLFGGIRANLATQWQLVAGFLGALWQDEKLVHLRIPVASLLADHFFANTPEARRAFSQSLFRDPEEALAAFGRSIALAKEEHASRAASPIGKPLPSAPDSPSDGD